MATNLDALCARCAQAIVRRSGPTRNKELEGRLNNALGVLQEDGFYAFYLFLKYKKLDQASGGEREGWPVWQELAGLLGDEKVGAPLTGSGEAAVVSMTEDLQRLLLAKQLAERTLIYARYGLRSLPKEGQ